MELKIVSLNCFDIPFTFYRINRIKKIAVEIIKLKPDIICLQEINFSTTAVKISKIFKAEGYNVFYNPGLIINKSGLFIASLIPLNSKKLTHFNNQGTFDSLQISDRFLGKGYQKITFSANNKNITLFNVHLVNIYKNSSKNQNLALKNQLNQLIEEINIENRETIVSGDLNFPTSNFLYSKLIKMTNLIDPLADSNLVTFSKNNTNMLSVYKNYTDLKIDYTLLSNELNNSITQKIIFDEKHKLNNKNINLTDHFGMFTSLKI